MSGLAVMLVSGVTTAASPSPVAQTASPLPDRIAIAQPPKLLDDFVLTDQEAKSFSFSQLRGTPTLLFFGFTHCPDVCPSTLAQLALLRNSADQRLRGTALVMISVDGERDTPAVLKAYLAQVLPPCIGLTGEPQAVRRIAAQFSAVFFKGLPDKPGDPYLVAHTSQIYLIDRQGRLRATFFDAPLDALRRTTAAIADEAAAPAPGVP
jgi:protein SCO1/2